MGRLAPDTPTPWSPIAATTSRDTIAARLRRINLEAIAIRRRGYTGTRSDEYVVTHATLDLLLYQYQMAEH